MKFFSKNSAFKYLIINVLIQMSFFGAFGFEETKYHVDKTLIYGNAHIADNSVLYYLGLNPGNDYTKAEIEKMVQKAYETGFFKQISIDYSKFKNIVIVNVIEQPIISSIQFYGNRKISDKDIINNIRLKTGMTFSDKKMKKDIENVLKLYQAKGLFNTMVNSKIIENEGGSITIAFEIKEGKKSVIEKISFVGNKQFDESELKQNILSTEWAFYRFFSNTYNYDPERFKVDAELINEYYQSMGYPYANVVNTVSELDSISKAFVLTFFIESGEKFNFGKVNFHDGIKIKDNKEILDALKDIKKGKLFDINTIRKVISKINDVLARKGYAFAEIKHTMNINPETKAMDVTITIKPTNKFFINKINIVNNTVTRDDVIRREMRVSENDSYDISKIERSLQRIRSLGYFSAVTFTPKQIDESDRVDLEIKVDEKRTGSAFFKIGYNTILGPFFGIDFAEPNLLGTGRTLSTNFQFAKLEKGLSISLVEPYFMGFDATAGISLFYDKRLYKQFGEIKNHLEEHGYYSASRGGIINTTYSLTEYLKHDLEYGLKFENIDYGKNANLISKFLLREKNTHVVSSVGHTLIYDKTDNYSNATQGYILRFFQSFAGVGGNSKYLQHIISAANYTPIYKDKIIMKISGRGGIINGLSQKVRPLDNFYSEDTMVRGFEYNGIGPRDKKTFDALGGKRYYTGSVEIKFPLGLPNEVGMHGVAFTDFATLYGLDIPKGIDTNTNNYFDSKKLRASYGVGVIWNSPLGLIRMDYGVPFMKTKFDKIQKFNFSIGRSF